MRLNQKLPSKGRVTNLDVSHSAERHEHRGRGAISNQTGRFERETRDAFDDGWGTIEDSAGRLDTTLTRESGA